eukprot:331298-Chlamydomonas_euryale.AAC.2
MQVTHADAEVAALQLSSINTWENLKVKCVAVLHVRVCMWKFAGSTLQSMDQAAAVLSIGQHYAMLAGTSAYPD